MMDDWITDKLFMVAMLNYSLIKFYLLWYVLEFVDTQQLRATFVWATTTCPLRMHLYNWHLFITITCHVSHTIRHVVKYFQFCEHHLHNDGYGTKFKDKWLFIWNPTNPLFFLFKDLSPNSVFSVFNDLMGTLRKF